MTQELRDVFVELADGSVRKVALQAQTFTTSDEPDTVYESRTLKWSVGDSGALTVHAFGTDRDRSQEDGFGAGVELSLATFAGGMWRTVWYYDPTEKAAPDKDDEGI